MSTLQIDNNIILGICALLLFAGCGEEVSSMEQNTTIIKLPKKQEKQIKTKVATTPPIQKQIIVEEKQVEKDEVPEEELLEDYATPKSEEELADEQTVVTAEIEEEVHQGVLPVKSEEELLSEDPKAKLISTFQKSAEELADELKSSKD